MSHSQPIQADDFIVYEREHFVQLYQGEGILLQNLKRFIGGGLGVGETCLLITTQQRQQALDERLAATGLNLTAARQTGQYYFLDAEDALRRVMKDGQVDHQQFDDIIGGLLRRCIQAGKPVRAFGEMVALLWEQGNEMAALALEALWSAAVKRYGLTLFCAYPASYFASSNRPGRLHEISKLHSSTIMIDPHAA